MADQDDAPLCGRYRLEQSIGRGGMADVHLAFDEKRQAPVAVKILREDMAEDPDFVRRFRREAEALARLDHPNIVRFYAFEQDGPIAFIVMDYIDGSTLRRYLHERRGPLELKEITPILRDVCSALHYAHLNGFVHRDLKPGNIMLKSGGKALLTDFGISRALEGATMTGAAMGTPAYMSPEQIAGAQVDPRADIYSFGVLLFEMATGRRPFTGDEPGLTQTGTTTRLQQAHLRLPPPDPRTLHPGLSPAAAAVILRALAKDPADRWPDVVSLRQAWETAVGAAPGGATASGRAAAGATGTRSRTDTPARPKTAPQPQAGRRSSPLWSLGLAGALLVTIVAAVLFLMSRPPDRQETAVQDTAPAVAQTPPGAQAPTATVPAVARSSPTLIPSTAPAQRGGGVQVATRALPTATPVPTRPAATATLLPTVTPAPTATPTAVPTRAPTFTAVPTATPAVVACPIAAAAPFQALWQQQWPRLGCAINQAAETDAATERFERGRMIWRKSNDMIYVMYDDGDWTAYPDISVDGEPEPAGFEAPPGLYTPVRGFGATWRARLGGTSARIGWATEAEYGLPIQFQDFEHGLMFVMNGKIYLLGNDGGRWLAP